MTVEALAPNRVQPGLFILLVVITTALYAITFSARVESGDSLRLFDAASSLVHFNDLRRDESLWQEPPQVNFRSGQSPFVPYELNEPLAPIAASFFYRLGLALPETGLLHAVWLMNVIVLALCVGLFFVIARALHYSTMVAFLGAIGLAFCTAFWPYSKTLFREPLVALFLLFVVYCFLQLRDRSPLHLIVSLLVAGICLCLAILTKNAAAFALPAFFVLLVLPEQIRSLPFQGQLRRIFDSLLLLAFAVTLFLAFVVNLNTALPTSVQANLPRDIEFFQVALHSYLFSSGGSIWGTSPILLFAIVGIWRLRQAERWREIAFTILLLLGYAAGHALLTGVHWFGGLSWPPRFLLPTVPFVMLLTLPTIEQLLSASIHRAWRILALLLVSYSAAIQIIAVTSFTDAYVGLLPAASNGLLEWLPGLNNPQYLRWVLLPQSWSGLGFDVAWIRAGLPLWIVVFAALAVIAFFLAQRPLRGQHPHRLSWLLPVILCFCLALGLRQLNAYDPLVWTGQPALASVKQILETTAQDGEPLFLADPTYDEFVMNSLRSRSVRPVVLGFQPGEAVSESEPARLTSAYPHSLLEPYAPRVIDQLATQHNRIWVLAHTTPFLSWSIRPLERYMATYYYPLTTNETGDPTVRLLSYDTTPAPTPFAMRLPEHSTALQFGDHIQLQGFTLPNGPLYAKGDHVPITFFWKTEQSLAENYVMAWFVVKADNAHPPIQGHDSMPVAGFVPTATWQTGELIYDNRALQLPASLPSGEYRIWVAIYPAGNSAERLTVSGPEVIDATLGVLPISLEIAD